MNNNTKSRFAFTTRRPVAIVMIVLGIAVFGLVSYKRLSWDLMPEISYPSFTVRTAYPGAAPEEVENIVSRPLEEQLSLIKDLISLTSISRPEQADILLEFNWDANLDRAAQEIREKLDQVKLDPAVEKPMILRYDPSLDPVLRIGVVSDLPLIDLRVLVEDEIARELEALPGVAAARVKGGYEKEILIKLDEKQLAATRIRFDQVTTRLAQENINLAGGNIKEGDTEYIVRTLSQFRNVGDIGNIIVDRRDNVMVRLKDIADISYSHRERRVITRVNQRESIEINIYKEADANIIEVSNRVLERLMGTPEQQRYVKAMARKTPKTEPDKGKIDKRKSLREKRMTNFLAHRLAAEDPNMEYHILADQSVFIKNSLNEVRNTLVFGGILAVLILYLFLRNAITTMIVAVAIPLSVIAAFAPLGLASVSLNLMSLGGLALGIGMLVDNSIVVIESIFRCREEGDGWVESAVRGVSEVGNAVIASTLTTIAVFFPIVFVEGIAGQIFGDLSLAVVFSLLASLMVSLFFIPMLASRKFNRTPEEGDKNAQLRQFAFGFERHRSPRHFLLIPWEILKNNVLLLYKLVQLLLLMGMASLVVLLYPLPLPQRVRRMPVQFIKNVTDQLSQGKRLWDDFFRLVPFGRYITSMSTAKPFYLWPVAWGYYLFRYVVAAFAFVFVRLVLTLGALFILFFKGLFIGVAALVVPVLARLTRGFNTLLTAVNKFYPRLLDTCLKNTGQIIGGALTAFALCLWWVLPALNSELIPEVHQGTLYVNITFPVGTPVEKSDRVLQDISRKIRELEQVGSIGYSAGTTEDELSEKEVGEHIGKITVMMTRSRDIRGAEEQAITTIRRLLADFADLDYNISRPVLFTMKPPIELVIKGFNLVELRRVGTELYEQIARVPGLKDVQSSIRPGFPELVVEFDRMRLSYYGMNAFDVASIIKNKIEGFVATKYKEKDRRVDVRVFLKDLQRQRAENIKNLIINPGGAIPIPLSGVARVSILSGPNEIRRVEQDRAAVISANLSGISLTAALEHIHRAAEDYPLPPGFTYELTGQNKEMETSTNSLIMALILAVFLVYIVMASQFESFLHPFLILFTIPMALVGVVLALYLLRIPMGVTVYIGMITLVGIVVNNAIILIDYINTLRERGMEKLRAIKQAGAVRLRPILITTSTTVLGLMPMALGMGEGTEIRMPMAVSIIAGLLSATFLTLVLIPVVYNKFSK